jgi:hypothetical protein
MEDGKIENKIAFEKKVVNGREIEFLESIHHETVTVFDWKDRIRILFGRPTRIVSQIYTKNSAIVSGSEAQVYVTPLIKRKPRTMGLMALSGIEVADGSNYNH